MESKTDQKNSNPFVNALLTDLYQVSMAYAYWSIGKHEQRSCFDLFFRKNPFKGEFTVFAGLEEALKFVKNFKFTKEMLTKMKKKFSWPEKFWDWLGTLDSSQVKIYAMPEGSVCFPRCPLMRVEGPLAVCQLLETTLLCLINYPALVCTNAARHRLAAGKDKILLEFGLRRAQGPDGGMSASRYAVMGGFDGTSNVEAAIEYGLECKGTHAHSFVTAFSGLDDVKDKDIAGKGVDFVAMVLKWRKQLKKETTNDGELAAFISFAQAFPKRFLALVDTYDTINSGCWNFICVSLALSELGFKPIGIRLDSGDLAYLSVECRNIFKKISSEHKVAFEKLAIVASNSLSEDIIHDLNRQGHEIDSFGVGTNLVTCKTQPALGCVYKLVELEGKPRIKISQEVAKVTIPGRKNIYRLYNKDGEPVLDMLRATSEGDPKENEKILCRHPFNAQKRVYVTPSKVEPLLKLVFDSGVIKIDLPPVKVVRPSCG
uniref:Nicotinate phosphoribosyltransferase n=1 Tax=Lotharella globosa TaxID=91324 RepID=A0A7S3YMI6_9EUKA